MSKRFFTKKVVGHWNRLPGEVVMAPNLTEFNEHLGNAQNCITVLCSSLRSRELDLIFMGPSNLRYCMILQLCFQRNKYFNASGRLKAWACTEQQNNLLKDEVVKEDANTSLQLFFKENLLQNSVIHL